MTDRELDDLGTSLLALDRQSKPRTIAPSSPEPESVADSPTAGEWTPEQLRRLDEAIGT